MFERMTSPPLPTGTGGEEGLIGPVALVLVDCSPTPRGMVEKLLFLFSFPELKSQVFLTSAGD